MEFLFSPITFISSIISHFIVVICVNSVFDIVVPFVSVFLPERNLMNIVKANKIP